jgi:CBS domain containing-hemolysin-like protein
MIAALLVLLTGLAIAGTAAAVGVATAAMTQVDLTRWVASRLRGVPGASAIIENPGRMLATANAVTTLGIVFAAAAVPALLAETTPTFLGVFTVSVGVPLFIGAAYLVPRVVGRRRAEAIVVKAVPWLEAVGRVLSPLVPRRDPSPRNTLAAVLSGADTEALAGADEMSVVSAVLAFADRPVRDLMTPRTAIVALPEDMPAGEAAHVCAQAGFSRYPTYRGSLDEVTGVVHTIDLLGLQPEDAVPVRPVLTVPGTTRAADLMLEMQRGRSHLATVLDEFGGTAGLVTLEDLLADLVEEIFGDRETAPPPGTPDAPLLEVEGNAPAERLHEVFGVAMRGRDVQTIGGLLVQALGRIPRPGERLQLRGLEFDILAATSTRVERVLVRKGPVRALSLDRSTE